MHWINLLAGMKDCCESKTGLSWLGHSAGRESGGGGVGSTGEMGDDSMVALRWLRVQRRGGWRVVAGKQTHPVRSVSQRQTKL